MFQILVKIAMFTRPVLSQEASNLYNIWPRGSSIPIFSHTLSLVFKQYGQKSSVLGLLKFGHFSNTQIAYALLNFKSLNNIRLHRLYFPWWTVKSWFNIPYFFHSFVASFWIDSQNFSKIHGVDQKIENCHILNIIQSSEPSWL